jgi:hypothetical protein
MPTIISPVLGTFSIASGDPSLDQPDYITRRRWDVLASSAAAPSPTAAGTCWGTLQLQYASFQANDDPALKLVIYTST